MEAIDLNDIRMALGTQANSLRLLHEKLDDLTAQHASFLRLRNFVDALDSVLGEIPAALDGLLAEPMFAMFADTIAPIKAVFESAQAELNRRRDAPAIESTATGS